MAILPKQQDIKDPSQAKPTIAFWGPLENDLAEKIVMCDECDELEGNGAPRRKARCRAQMKSK